MCSAPSARVIFTAYSRPITAPFTLGRISKVSDIAFEALVEGGQARPAPYLARAKWVRFDDLAALDDEDVAGWLAAAHALVSAKLTRVQRRALGLEGPIP